MKKHSYLLFTIFVFINIANIHSQTTVDFIVPGTSTFTIPAGVSSITVECIGGGGGGGAASATAAGGGGGGAYSKATITVSAGAMYSYTVGAGGGPGSDGGISSFGTGPVLVAAYGGTGTTTDAPNGGAGGSAASGIGTTKFSGGNGGNFTDFFSFMYWGGGGGGGAGATGNGGNGAAEIPGTGNAPGGTGGDASGFGAGQPGNVYGGGASGAGTALAGPAAGGTGANGLVRITYTVASCAGNTQASAANTASITTTTADLSWTTGGGAGDLVVLRAGSAVDANPSDGTTYTANANFSSGDQIGTGNYVVYGGAGASVSLTGLTAGITYHYAIYAYDGAGTCYLTPALTGNFTTSTGCTPPTTQASAASVACVLSGSMDLSFTRGNGAKVIVLAKAGSAVDASPIVNTTYTANSVFGSGDNLGTGNYVVYSGTDASVQITGLSQGVTYHFAIFEFDESPNCYNVTSPATVSQITPGGEYVSSTVVQNTNSVTGGDLVQDIIKLKITTQNGLNHAVTLNNIVFNSNGSTNTATDISNIRIFYTGSVNAFADTTQYGTTFTTFGTNTATDIFSLLDGDNYFWIAYDIPISATNGNVLDAEIVSINITDINGTADYVPTDAAPPGNRPLPSGTCPIATPDPRNAFAGCNTACCQGENITNITFGTTTATDGYGCNSTTGYDDKTATNIFTVSEGNTYAFAETNSQWLLSYQWCVWIDWNGNGDLRDPGERYPATGTISTFGSSSQNITIPVGVAPGNHLVRVWYQEDSYPPDDCPYRTARAPLSVGLGQVIDLTLVVDDASGSVWTPPSGASYCTTVPPSVTTPVTYNVGDVASPLTATGTNLTWYSNPEGGAGTSTAPTPSTATPGTQMFYVSQDTGTCESPRTQIAVKVNSVPLVAPIATANQSTCMEPDPSIDVTGLPTGSWTLNPGSIAGSGDSTRISLVSNGSYSFTYTNSLGCISPVSNTVTIVPTVPTATGGTQGVWIGGKDTAWNDPMNWCAIIPDATTDVFIPAVADHMPMIDNIITPALARDLNIASGGSLSMTQSSLSLYGNIVNDGTYNQTGGKLIVTGSAAQTFGGSTAGLTVHDMQMNNANGLTLLNGNLTVDSILDMTLGDITTGSNEVHIIGNISNEIQNFSANSYINGRLRRNITGTDLFQYPIGDATNYEQIDLNLSGITSATSILGFYTPSAAAAMTPITEAAITYNSTVAGGIWTMTPDVAIGGGSYDVKVYPIGFTGQALVKSKFTSNDWNWHGSTLVSATERTGYSEFSNFTLASTSIVLPANKLIFDGEATPKGNLLNWNILISDKAAYFELEKSKDGKSFQLLSKVNAQDYDEVGYKLLDEKPFERTYYRLKQIDTEGTIKTSKTILINNTFKGKLSIYPNPANELINISLKNEEVLSVEIYNNVGELIITSFNNQVDISNLSNGIYVVKLITTNETIYIEKLIKQ